MSLEALHQRMAWPTATAILEPKGAGPRILQAQAREKIERTIRSKLGATGSVRVGLLTKNPDSPNTEAPIAVICEFQTPVDASICSLAHRLAWNFARCPLLVMVEPHQVRTWTCCERPSDAASLLDYSHGEIADAHLDLAVPQSPAEHAAHALHWVRLATGDFFQRFPDRFRRDGRADRVLLEELTKVRRRLQRQGLDDDTIHDLLARVVFIQFLFDRKDADGRPALNPALLSRLYDDGLLINQHETFHSILSDYQEAYRFFRWLNSKFNGDLFPGKGRTKADRTAEWQAEMDRVKPVHLQTLAGLVRGLLDGRQPTFWPLYSFDVIPLEFVSSIYEEFVTSAGAHYTPAFLVDFMLDQVLPWDGENWKLRILDPACGSGIFLVKAYQRLIHRWKNANPGQRPSAAVLRRLLERNLFGVDIDPHAVRVSSFSLYLTMCDEIDPKSYLNSTKFPRLRDRRLIHADFFEEDRPGFSTTDDGPSYDLVIGNAPWGKDTITTPGSEWANHPERKWPIANQAIGTLFLAKAASLTKPHCQVSMIQPASSLLFNRSGPANRFREKFFATYKVEEIVNLSTLRFELFENATSPPCIVTMRATEPDGEPLIFVSPKQMKPTGGAEVAESSYTVVVEPHDLSQVWPDEASSEPHVWTTLAWGGRRDFAFLQRLHRATSLETMKAERLLKTREGVIRGDRKKRQDIIVGRRILRTEDFPKDTFLVLDAERLPINDDPMTDSKASTSFDAFECPQLIIKQSWTTDLRRFRAVVVRPTADAAGIVCEQSFITAHTNQHESLESAVLSISSSLCVYYMLLTSGRLASYRPEPLVSELRSTPIASPRSGMLDGVSSLSDVDDRVRQEFSIKDAEWVLVEDVFNYTLPDFKGDELSPGRLCTGWVQGLPTLKNREPHLSAYCEYFLRVLKAGFGEDKPVCATVFEQPSTAPFPIRLVAIHLNWDRSEQIVIEPMNSKILCQRLAELDQKLIQVKGAEHGGIFFQRVARVYHEMHKGRKVIPTIYIVKPDRIRYWTRSAALRDADEVAADVHLWGQTRVSASAGRRAK